MFGYRYNTDSAKIENTPSSVKELYLNANQITKIKNIPFGVKYLYLKNNPCHDTISCMSLDEIKWMSNFDENIKIMSNYLIPDLINIIKKYSMYDVFY